MKVVVIKAKAVFAVTGTSFICSVRKKCKYKTLAAYIVLQAQCCSDTHHKTNITVTHVSVDLAQDLYFHVTQYAQYM